MYLINALVSWYRDRKYPPRISVYKIGQATANPCVNVSAESRYGAQTIYTFADNEQGNAQATMYSNSLAFIMRCAVNDTRVR